MRTPSAKSSNLDVTRGTSFESTPYSLVFVKRFDFIILANFRRIGSYLIIIQVKIKGL